MLCGDAKDWTIEGYGITDDLGHGGFGEVKKCIENVYGRSRLHENLPLLASGAAWAMKSVSSFFNRNRDDSSALRASQHSVFPCDFPPSCVQLQAIIHKCRN